MRHYKPHEERPSPPYDPHALRPDQKRCHKCQGVLIHEQQRCPFCGNAPWYWNPSSRFLLVTVIIAVFLLLLLPLMTRQEKPYSTPVSDAH